MSGHPVRVERDPHAADAAYIHLTQRSELSHSGRTIPVKLPFGVEGQVLLDFQAGKLVGIEVLGAENLLPRDLLDAAEESEA